MVVASFRKALAVRQVLLAGAITIGTVLAGCAQEGERVIVLRPSVAWTDLGTSSSVTASEGFEILVPQGTEGLFPASMAIVRMSVADAAQDPARRVVLDMEPPNDFLPWNSAFDSLRYVSDAFPLHSLDMSGDRPTAARLCSAATDLSARICLVYGGMDDSATQSRVRGVIFDARTGTALARIQSLGTAPEPCEAIPSPEQVEDDLSHCDPRVLADRAFSRLVFECIKELKRLDRTAPVQPQEGWKPDGPILPRRWPPWRDDERRN